MLWTRDTYEADLDRALARGEYDYLYRGGGQEDEDEDDYDENEYWGERGA